MTSQNIELNLKTTLNLPSCVTLINNKTEEDYDFGDALGGVLRDGQYVWIAVGPHLDIFNTKTNTRVSSYTFEHHLNTIPSLITCVTEICVPDISSPMLAVGVQYQTMGGMICIFSVQGSRVLRSIEILDKITCCSFLSNWILSRSGVSTFDGCLVYGSDVGTVYLVDLCLKKCSQVLYNKEMPRYEIELHPILNVDADVGADELKKYAKKSRRDGHHLSVQLQVLQDSGPVLSMIIVQQQLTLVIGLHDGRMILYDLFDLQAFHLAYPPEMNSPLIKLCCIEPADDPRACMYVWALHSNKKSAVAVMHSVMFEYKRLNPEIGQMLYENFQSCSVRLTILLNEPGSRAISCQSIMKTTNYEEQEEITSICAIGWESTANQKSNLFVFDLNQWYKEQMPDVIELDTPTSCIASFGLTQRKSLEIWIDKNSVTPFDSVQRPEEHFYPNALGFQCFVLSDRLVDCLTWPGLQNRALEYLATHGSMTVFDPSPAYSILSNAALQPQFADDLYGRSTNSSIALKREYILSVALEYNCVRLLRECGKQWGDGSYLGGGIIEDHDTNGGGVSLSTLTDWIWKRAQLIQNCCNSLCVPLFDHSQRQVDFRTKKQLAHSLRQLKLLANVLEMTLNVNKESIPEKVFDRLQTQLESLRLSSEHQEVLQWLVNTELLPEGQLMSYPFHVLNEFYQSQRFKLQFGSSLNPGSCRYLYVDRLIEQEGQPKEIAEQWKTTKGLFPPSSLQEMLRVLLTPKIQTEVKLSLILYLFLDLSVALEDDDRYNDVLENLIKFPTVFRLCPSVIKRTQAFWKFDHGQFETALDEIFSPLSGGGKQLKFWQYEFLIETLLRQNMPKLALRVLRSNSVHHNPSLEIKTLLANDCLSEAFQVQRVQRDDKLLKEFFETIFARQKYAFLLDFALNSNEEKVLCEHLNEINLNVNENFHIIYLLQRSKYVDAVQLIEKIQSRSRTRLHDNDNSKLILSAYNMTLSPVVKEISRSYFQFNAKQLDDSDRMAVDDDGELEPFSSQLIKNKMKTPGELFRLTFDCIDRRNNRVGMTKRTIPFLQKSGCDGLFNSETINPQRVVVPKLIDSKDMSGKRKIECEDVVVEEESSHPRKRVALESDYQKRNLLTKLKEKKGFDFSKFYEISERQQSSNVLSTPIVERTRSQMTFFDREKSPHHSILKPVDSPRRAESVEKSIKFSVAPKALNFTQMSPSKKAEPFVFGTARRSLRDKSEEAIDEETISPNVSVEEVLGEVIGEDDGEKMTPERWNKMGEEPEKVISRRSTSKTPDKIVDSSVEIVEQLPEPGSSPVVVIPEIMIEKVETVAVSSSIELDGGDEAMDDEEDSPQSIRLLLDDTEMVQSVEQKSPADSIITVVETPEDEEERRIFFNTSNYKAAEQKDDSDEENSSVEQLSSDQEEDTETCRKKLFEDSFNEGDEYEIDMEHEDDIEEEYDDVDDVDEVDDVDDLDEEEDVDEDDIDEHDDIDDTVESELISSPEVIELGSSSDEESEGHSSTQFEVVDRITSDVSSSLNKINQSPPKVEENSSSDDVSAMLYDDVDYDMTTTDEPDNLNNALMIDYNYSQGSVTSGDQTKTEERTEVQLETIVEEESNADDPNVAGIGMKVFDTVVEESNVRDDLNDGIIETTNAEDEETLLNKAVLLDSADITEVKEEMVPVPSVASEAQPNTEVVIDEGKSIEVVVHGVDEKSPIVVEIPNESDIIVGAYSLRKTRARSASIEAITKIIETEDRIPMKRSRRSMSVNNEAAAAVLTPSKGFKFDLEKIDENIALTPVRAARKTALIAAERLKSTPRRRSSITGSKENLAQSSDSLLATPTTTNRGRRSMSIESNTSISSAHKRASLRLAAKRSEEPDEPPTTPKKSDMDGGGEQYLETRRLTRHQLAVEMEKHPMTDVGKSPSPGKRKSPRSVKRATSVDSQASEAESLASDTSFRSRSSAISRSSRGSKTKNAGRRTKAIDEELKTIEEDSGDKDEDEPAKKKTRPRKASSSSKN